MKTDLPCRGWSGGWGGWTIGAGGVFFWGERVGQGKSDKEIKRMIAESYDIITDSPTKRIYEAVKKIQRDTLPHMEELLKWQVSLRWQELWVMRYTKNPDPEHIPCFRVVNSKGELSGAFALVVKMSRQEDLWRTESKWLMAKLT